MPQNVRLWQVSNSGELNEIPKSELASEKQLEDWIETDIDILDRNLIIIGRQVATDYGHFLDFLCMNNDGDLVVVELKRDRTPRDVTAQALDYASWVENLSADKISDIADDYLKEDGPLEAAFNRKFRTDLPETINDSHHMLIVASDIDSSTERIVQYLSSRGIGINFVTFEHFLSSDQQPLLSRVFMIEQEEVTIRTNTRSRRRRITLDQLMDISRENGVLHLFKHVEEWGPRLFDARGQNTSARSFSFRTSEGRQTTLTIHPSDSNSKDGLKYRLYTQRLAEHLEISVDRVLDFLPKSSSDWAGYWQSLSEEGYSGHEGYFKNTGEIDDFFKPLLIEKK